MTAQTLPSSLRNWRLVTLASPVAQLMIGLSLALAVALALVGPDRLLAQIEGDRGIAPIASSRDVQVGGIEVETTGKDAAEARLNGWKLAKRKGWEKLGGPTMGDGQLDSMVTAVVIEREMIGPRRYIATLGVVFDRQKAGGYVKSGSGRNHSAPLLVIPVLYSGGVSQVFEVRGPWQKAWAGFNASTSAVDYVRAAGSGGDSLMLTAGQAGRRSRQWWRSVLDQFGASDVIMPVAKLEREWPGGPVRGTFTARYGPDNIWLDSFKLEAKDEAGVPDMLNQALVRMDQIYTDALARGLLKPDQSLTSDTSAIDAAIASLTAAIRPATESTKSDSSQAGTPDPTASDAPAAPATVATYTVQFASPDAQAVDAALGAVRGAAGVKGASTTSIAIGGTSVMRVTYAGDLDGLAAALRARGWQVSVGSNALSIRR
jgi:hypothetical protein